jgi:hypothetical protein
LRVKVIKLSKNIEEREKSTSSLNKFEDKHSRLPERNNEENSYVEVLKGRNHGQQYKKGMSIIEIHIQQDLPHLGRKEASTKMKGST